MTTIGGMEVVTPLSTGGMGRVLLAKRVGPHGFEKLVAVKVIRGELVRYDEIRRMFLDEAKVLSNLVHPAVAQVHDFGEERGTLFLAMEYVPGVAVSRLSKMRDGPLPPVIAARLIAETCRGLHAAHELKDLGGRPLGVVHRDVTPHNLMLTFDGKVKILDFGIALVRGREAEDTKNGLVKGKVAYVAPEQLDQQPVDRRADVYGAAVVLHELLTGQPLFGKAIAADRKKVPKPSKLADVPRALDAIVRRGLEVKPKDRYADAKEMAQALEKFLATAGGESLEDFAERELADAERQHRAWLAAVLAGDPVAETTQLDVTPSRRASIALPPDVAAPPQRYGLGRASLAFAAVVIAVVVAAMVFPERASDLADRAVARVSRSLPAPVGIAASAEWEAIAKRDAVADGMPADAPEDREAAEAIGELEDDAEAIVTEEDEGDEDADDAEAIFAEEDDAFGGGARGEGDAEENFADGDGGDARDGAGSSASSAGAGGAPDGLGGDNVGANGERRVGATTEVRGLAGGAPTGDASEARTVEAGAPAPGAIDRSATTQARGTRDGAPRSASPGSDTGGSARSGARALSSAPKRKKRRAADTSYGSLSILTRPGGWIYVGGKPFGRTPLKRARIHVGHHVVALRRPGDKRPRWVSKVYVRPGRHVRIRLR